MKNLRGFFSIVVIVGIACLLSSCMEIAIRSENLKSLALYGKVVDQNGIPLSGAKVEGSIGLNISMVESGGKRVYATTDSQGCFHFLHIHGVGIGLSAEKEGYYFNRRLTAQRPENYQPNPANPIILTMWKVHAPQELKHLEIEENLVANGPTIAFDTSSGNVGPNGDFRITLSNFGQQKSGLVRKYDWHFTIEMLKGGLLSEKDPYPFLAPIGGYQPSFEFFMSSNSSAWRSQFEQAFYITNSQGNYGRMNIKIYSATTPPFFHASLIVNPSGSPNLEPNLSK